MAKPSLFSISFCLVVLFQGSLALRQFQQQSGCQLDQLSALEPDNRIQFEAGRVESWDPNHRQFQCAGVAIVRRTIDPNGLLLPQYSNAPQLVYIVQGRGLTGALFPGCAETYQEPQQGPPGEGSRRLQDQHQKLRPFREGDVLALPAGVAHWCYNDGDQPVVTVALLDTNNRANQLDFNPRNFYLAGSPEEEFPQREDKQQRQQLGRPRYQGRYGRPGQQQGPYNNVFAGIDSQLLAEAFNVNEEVARRLQGENDNRGNIVRVKEGGLRVVRPPATLEQEEEEAQRGCQGGRGSCERRGYDTYNGLEETLCTMRIKENIGNPSRADVYTPEAGRISTVNSHNLPILRWLQLSAERGVLYNDALMLPHWNLNAHSVIYVIRGEAQVQVVDHQGRTVFNGKLRRGQVLTVPQNFAVVKRAERERFEWVAFKTNDNAMMNPLAGRSSAIRAMPAEVIANAYQISVEDARRLKFGREETHLSSPRSRSGARATA